MSIVLTILMLVCLVVPATAQECYRFFGPFDFPGTTGEAGQTSFEALNNAGVGLGRHASQLDDGYLLLPRQQGRTFRQSLLAALIEGKNWGRGLNDKRDRCGMVQLPGRFAGFLQKKDGTVLLLEVPGQLGTECLDVDNLRNMVGVSHRLTGPTGGGTDGWWRYKGQFYTINHPQGMGSTTLTSIVSAGGLAVQILGWRADQFGRYHSFLYMPTTAPDVGTFAELTAPGGRNTFLRTMNDAGTLLAGEAQPEDTQSRAVIYTGGVWYDAHPPFAGAISSTITGVNNTKTLLGNVIIEGAVGEQHLGWVALHDATCTTGTPLPLLP